MEKFGVEEDDSTDKTASDAKQECPKCHRVLRPVHETGVLLCTNCGSEPFEKKVLR